MGIIRSKKAKSMIVTEGYWDIDNVIFENDLFKLGTSVRDSLIDRNIKEEAVYCRAKGAAEKFNVQIRYDHKPLDPKDIKGKSEFRARYYPETARVTWQTIGFRCSPDGVRQFIDILDNALEFCEKVKKYLEQREKDIDNGVDISDDDKPTIEIQ